MSLTNKRYLLINSLCFLIPIFGIVLFISWGIYYLQNVKLPQDMLKAQEEYSLKLKREFVLLRLNTIISDIKYIAGQPELFELFNSHSNESDLIYDIKLFSKFKGIYDQIRVLDNSGQEVFRIDLRGSKPVMLSDSELQFKGQRYYFKDIADLQKDQIYMSQFDLNVEHGTVDIPYKPMLRFGTPLVDSEGNKLGIVVVNYLGNKLLEELTRLSFASPGTFMLVNSDGYWLKGSYPEQEWGFMISSRAEQKIQSDYPKLWEEISNKDSGQMMTEDGLSTFLKIYPAQAGIVSNESPSPFLSSTHSLISKDFFWVILSHIPKEKILADNSGFVISIFWVDLVLFILLGFVGRYLVVAHEKRKQAERNLRMLNAGLEEKVKIRTRELTETNSALNDKIKEYTEIVNEKDIIESQLRQAQKMEAIGTLAGGIAHDFNNILSPILGYTEIVAMELGEQHPLQPELREIISSAHRAKDLVQQILTFSRISSLEMSPLKLQPLIKEAVKLLRHSIPSTIEIKVNMAPDCRAIKANSTQIHQILMNLCTNAYHAMLEKGGVLSISLSEAVISSDDYSSQLHLSPGVYLQLQVSDTGIGMSSELQKKIFEPYFTTKEQGKGTGLGLSVVHGIVRSLHGQITVSSEPEGGTRFQVYLPAIQSTIGPEEVLEKDEIPRGAGRILIVDDEEAIVQVDKRILESLGYTVTATTDPEEVLMAIQTQPGNFDLVISDMTMPKMTGLDLAEQITAINPDIPIIISTGSNDIVKTERFKKLAIKECLNKPATVKEMAHAVRNAIGQTI
ncbi:MAG: ATP-binding protein [Desulforhopalus sp.]